MRCYRSIPQHKPIIRNILAVAVSTAILGAAIVAPFSNITVHAEALPDVAGAAATTVGQYLYSIFAASGNSLANHEVNSAMMTELSITMQDLAEEGIITLRGQVYDPNDQEQINEVIQAFGQRTGDVEVNVAQFAQRIQALDSAQTARLEQAAFSLDKLETDPNLSYPDYFVYFSYALAGYLEAGMIEGAKLYEIAMNASDNVIIALDDIHDSIIEFFADNIQFGESIDFVVPEIDMSQMYQNGGVAYYEDTQDSSVYVTFYYQDYMVPCHYTYTYNNRQWEYFCLVNTNNVDLEYKYYHKNNSNEYVYDTKTASGNFGKTLLTDSRGWYYGGWMEFASAKALSDWLEAASQAGNPIKKYNYSPDIITENGNAYTGMPDTAPAINANEGLLPIPTADIAPFEQAVANNNAQQLYPDNAPEAELLINPYIVPNTAPAPEPEPGYNPIPDQPTIPEKDPISSEQEQKNLGGATVGLEDIFPFCIPFDIAGIFDAFTAERQAPVIRCPVDLNGNYIEIDLSVFDDAAALLRTLELIAFVVGLLMVARKLIGAGG